MGLIIDFSKKYKIKQDSYLGYEVLVKYWFLPFWVQCRFTNTHCSTDDAKEYIKNGCRERYNSFVEYVDKNKLSDK